MTGTEVASTRRRQGGASVVMYRMGGRSYPARTVPNCKVCDSDYRFEIEEEIAAGRTYAHIEASLLVQDPECGLSRRNISDHYKNQHMPLEQEASRRIVERRAEYMGRSIETGVDYLVDGISAAEVVIQKTFEAIQRGELKPDIKDMLTAVRIVETFGGTEQGADQGTYVEAFMIYHEVASQFMSTEAFEAFGTALSRNPTLKALVARHNAVPEEDEEPQQQPAGEEVVVEDAEMVEEESDQPGLESSTGILDNGAEGGQDTSISKPTRQRKRKP